MLDVTLRTNHNVFYTMWLDQWLTLSVPCLDRDTHISVGFNNTELNFWSWQVHTLVCTYTETEDKQSIEHNGESNTKVKWLVKATRGDPIYHDLLFSMRQSCIGSTIQRQPFIKKWQPFSSSLQVEHSEDFFYFFYTVCKEAYYTLLFAQKEITWFIAPCRSIDRSFKCFSNNNVSGLIGARFH